MISTTDICCNIRRLARHVEKFIAVVISTSGFATLLEFDLTGRPRPT